MRDTRTRLLTVMTVREPTQFQGCGQLTKAVETLEESPGGYWAAQRTSPSNNLNDTVFAVSLFAFRLHNSLAREPNSENKTKEKELKRKHFLTAKFSTNFDFCYIISPDTLLRCHQLSRKRKSLQTKHSSHFCYVYFTIDLLRNCLFVCLFVLLPPKK